MGIDAVVEATAIGTDGADADAEADGLLGNKIRSDRSGDSAHQKKICANRGKVHT
jgi:hypothetical protein